jgi:hypothetical protein
MIEVLRRRIEERFISPVARLMGEDISSPTKLVPGFAILALDCLLIDTIQSFREGRKCARTPAASLKNTSRSFWMGQSTVDCPKIIFSGSRRGHSLNDLRHPALGPELKDK